MVRSLLRSRVNSDDWLSSRESGVAGHDGQGRRVDDGGRCWLRETSLADLFKDSCGKVARRIMRLEVRGPVLRIRKSCAHQPAFAHVLGVGSGVRGPELPRISGPFISVVAGAHVGDERAQHQSRASSPSGHAESLVLIQLFVARLGSFVT